MVQRFIKISDGHHYQSGTGEEFTSVDFVSENIGSVSPCDNQKEIAKAIQYAQKTIRADGDIPIIVDNRKRAGLMAFMGDTA